MILGGSSQEFRIFCDSMNSSLSIPKMLLSSDHLPWTSQCSHRPSPAAPSARAGLFPLPTNHIPQLSQHHSCCWVGSHHLWKYFRGNHHQPCKQPKRKRQIFKVNSPFLLIFFFKPSSSWGSWDLAAPVLSRNPCCWCFFRVELWQPEDLRRLPGRGWIFY